jgi:hypothetical protein
MVKSTIGVALLSLGAVLSGAPRLDQAPGAPMQGTTMSPVPANVRSSILGQERELIVRLPRGYDRRGSDSV